MLWSSLKIKIPKDKDTLFQIAAAILTRYQTFEVASLWLWTFWSCQLWRNSQKFGKFLKSSGEWGQPTGKGETAKSCQNFFEDKTQGPFDKYDCLKKTFFIAYLIFLYPLSKMNWLTVIEYTIDLAEYHEYHLIQVLLVSCITGVLLIRTNPILPWAHKFWYERI